MDNDLAYSAGSLRVCGERPNRRGMDHGALPDQNGQGQRHHQRPQRLGHRTGQAEVHPRLAPERDNSQRGNSEDRERAAGGNDKRINIDRGGHSIDACKQMRGENENYFTDIA